MAGRGPRPARRARYLTKPLNLETPLETLRALLDRRSST